VQQQQLCYGDALERAALAGVDAIIIDTAHGHLKRCQYVEEVKINSHIDVIVGIATPEAALFL
jgi:hypothetical protein